MLSPLQQRVSVQPQQRPPPPPPPMASSPPPSSSSADGSLLTIWRLRFVWAVEHLFDPEWNAVSEKRKPLRQPHGSEEDGIGSDEEGRVLLTGESLGDAADTAAATGRRSSRGGGGGDEPQRRNTVTISIELIGFVCFALWVILYGVKVWAEEGAKHLNVLHYPTELLPPRRLFVWLFGAVAHDSGLDAQWFAYEFFSPFLALLSVLAAWATAQVRRCQEERPTGSSQAAPKRTGLRGVWSSFVWRQCRRPNALGCGHALLGVSFIFWAHGTHAVFPMAIITLNYVLFTSLQRCRCMPQGAFLLLTWTFHIALMCANEHFEGYEFFYWVQYFLPTREGSEKVLGVKYKPIIPRLMRWFITYRMYVLRMISFNYDMWEANRNASAARERAVAKHLKSCVECAKLRQQSGRDSLQSPREPSQSDMDRVEKRSENEGADRNGSDGAREEEKDVRVHVVTSPSASGTESHDGGREADESCRCYRLRTEFPRDTSEYNYTNYVAYLLFFPTYVAGPISSYNAFVSHLSSPSKSMTRRDMCVYAARILFTHFVMMCLQHTVFLTAFSTAMHLVQEMPPGSQALFLYFYLAYLYLKFNFIWKTSRLFSMWCGVEVPENMRQCFSNSCFTRDFWRSWHASFNLWVVRYMYIPMGGRRRVLLSIAPIFLFIAIWHDHKLHLVKWALCIVVIFAAEVLVGAWYSKLSRSFESEVEKATALAAAGDRGDDGGGGVGNDALERSGLETPRPSGGLRRSAARLVATRLTPLQRQYAKRVMTAWGGALAVFAQIIANIVGYSVQQDKTDGIAQSEVNSEATIAKMLRMARENAFVCVVAALFLYTIASSGTLSKKRASLREKELKKLYGLQ